MKIKFTILLAGLLLLFSFAEAQNDPADSLLVIEKIFVKGIKKTKSAIILRELPVKEGDTIISSFRETLEDKMVMNLMNTSLFNFVEVKSETEGSGINFIIRVEERWYLWPTFYLEIADRNLNTWWNKKDFGRLNYRLGLLKQNFRGRMEELSLQYQAGYEEEYSLEYTVPYLDKKKTHGLMLLADHYAFHTIQYGSVDHSLVYATVNEDYISRSLQLSLSYIYRPGIHMRHQLTVGWRSFWLHDTLLYLNRNYASDNKESFLYFSYILKLDHRDYRPYPLNGFYTDFEARKFGLPGAELDYSLVKTTFRKYFTLADGKWFFASGVTAQAQLGKPMPYYLMADRGLGYHRDFVRGMEYYVFDQPDWIYAKNNLKRKVLPRKIINIGFLENKLFGEKFSKIPVEIFANVFYDAGYVMAPFSEEAVNPLVNRWQHGFGIGVDLVTYYDKVLRTELTWNHLGEAGVYFHMIAPI